MDAWYEEDKIQTKREKRIIFFVITTILIIFSVLVIVFLTLGLLTSFGDIIYEDPPSTPFYQSISKNALLNHLQEFQSIAEKYSNSRSVNNGYNASLEYVKSQLQNNTNYNVYQQYFTVSEMVYSYSSFKQISPVSVIYIIDSDYSIIENSPVGNIIANISVANDGCSLNSFDDFIPGSIALVDSSICDTTIKAKNAEQSGAVGLLIYNDITQINAFSGELDDNSNVNIPILGISYLVGIDLSSGLLPQVSIEIQGGLETSYTSNLIAETITGNSDSIIIIGSHLDSVPAGPGINDNGSGSAVNLELALQVSKYNLVLNSKIYFAFWGAEELGLLGSSYFVNQLSKQEKSAIQVNLNYDMLASPNFFRGVYNGSQAEPPITESCTKIEGLYKEFWDNNHLPYELTEFNGRSDYGPFLDANITAGGLKTGSNGIKSQSELQKYGGLGNEIYDPCYHQSCDTIDNINIEILLENAQAAANILQELVSQTNLHSYLFSQ